MMHNALILYELDYVQILTPQMDVLGAYDY